MTPAADALAPLQTPPARIASCAMLSMKKRTTTMKKTPGGAFRVHAR